MQAVGTIATELSGGEAKNPDFPPHHDIQSRVLNSSIGRVRTPSGFDQRTWYAMIPGMQLTFVQLTGFVNEWKHFRLTDEDLRELEKQLLANPEAGAVVAGAGGLRKMRFAPPSRRSGKSGAFRIAYAYLPTKSIVYFLSLFAKSDKANLTAAEKARFRAVIETLKSRN